MEQPQYNVALVRQHEEHTQAIADMLKEAEKKKSDIAAVKRTVENFANQKFEGPKLITGTSSVSLAVPSFASTEQHKDALDNTPLRELEVVDIYKESAGNIVNSYTEISSESNNLLDNLKTSFDNFSFKDALKDVTSLANKAKSAMTAINNIKSGNLGGIVSGIAGASNLLSVTGVTPLAQKALSVANAVSTGKNPLGTVLNTAGAVGLNVSTANRLVSNIGSLSNAVDRAKSASGVMGGLNALTSLTNVASSVSGSLDAFSKYNFENDLSKTVATYTNNADKAKTSLGGLLSGVGTSLTAAKTSISQAGSQMIASLSATEMGEDAEIKPSILESNPAESANLIYALSTATSSLGVKGYLSTTLGQIGENTKAGQLLVSKAVEQFAATEDLNQLADIQKIAGSKMPAASSMKTILANGKLAGVEDVDYYPFIKGVIDQAKSNDINWDKTVVGGTSMTVASNIGNPQTTDLLRSYSGNIINTINIAGSDEVTKPKVDTTAYMASAATFLDFMDASVQRVDDAFNSIVGRATA